MTSAWLPLSEFRNEARNAASMSPNWNEIPVERFPGEAFTGRALFSGLLFSRSFETIEMSKNSLFLLLQGSVIELDVLYRSKFKLPCSMNWTLQQPIYFYSEPPFKFSIPQNETSFSQV